ncbi:MAG: hypothetical protein LKG21_00385 [Ruminococcus sp.]|jgi:hypothetical protein|nr:hypothetical protein [Ruminococcus sp.]
MKKKAALILAIMICTVITGGCGLEVNVNNGGEKVSIGSTTDDNDSNNAEISVSDSNSNSSENSKNTESSQSSKEKCSSTADCSTSKADTNKTSADSSKTENSTDVNGTAQENSESSSEQPIDVGTDFKLDNNGAVVLDNEKKNDDEVKIEAAQVMFKLACDTEWKYNVGCPYKISPDCYIENNFKWKYYEVTDTSVKTLDDVKKDYYKVFSDKYNRGDELNDLYIEKNGKLYALSGERGSNIYYKDSKITGIQSKSDDEIVFTVENHYTGDDFNNSKPTTETTDFSVVIKDGAWRVGEFTMPY